MGSRGSNASVSRGGNKEGLNRVVLRSDGSATWGDALTEWRAYLMEKENENLFFIGDGVENYNELLIKEYAHRFRDEYTKMQYAKIQSFVSGALDEYDDPYLVFLTRSSSTTDATGDPRPPIDHLDELRAAWDHGVRYELGHSMKATRKKDNYPARDYEYLRILEPTTEEGYGPSGYAHEHIAIIVDGEVTEERFHSVIMKHVEKAPNAQLEAHEFDDSIEIKSAEELNNPGAYMFKYLGKTWESDEMVEFEERFAALLFETGARRFQPTDGAQRWMQPDDQEEGEDWIFAGVGTDEQAHQVRQFEDLDEFRLVTNADGLRSWLSKRRGGEIETGTTWEYSEETCDSGKHTFEDSICKECGFVLPRPPPD